MEFLDFKILILTLEKEWEEADKAEEVDQNLENVKITPINLQKMKAIITQVLLPFMKTRHLIKDILIVLNIMQLETVIQAII